MGVMEKIKGLASRAKSVRDVLAAAGITGAAGGSVVLDEKRQHLTVAAGLVFVLFVYALRGHMSASVRRQLDEVFGGLLGKDEDVPPPADAVLPDVTEGGKK